MSTQSYTPEKAQSRMDILRATPNKISEIVERLDEQAAADILADLISCNQVWSHDIYAALTLDNPTLAEIHPDDWNKTVRYQNYRFDHLLTKFTLDRKILLGVLENLEPDQWLRRATMDRNQYEVYGLVWRLSEHDIIKLAQIKTAVNRR